MMRDRDHLLDPAEVGPLLDELCVRLGFCLPPNAREELQRAPPGDVESFTRAVFLSEGLEPDLVSRHLHRQVRAMVEAAFHGP